jgi:radical SAM superfamily enzyme YgiQ (UPF0313 family)
MGFRLAAMPEPLALELLAAALGRHEVEILDMRLDGDLRGALQRFSPDVVGVTALTTEVYAAQDVLREVKSFSADIVTVVGGHHASLLPQDFFTPQTDVIVLGEGEETMAAVMDALEAGHSLGGLANVVWRQPDGSFVANPRQESRPDMDRMPVPRRDLTRKYRPEYFFLFDGPDTSVATSRGCPYRCLFCSVWEFHGGKTRQAAPRHVVDDLKTVETEHVTFIDDNFLMNYRRESEIADLIRAEGIQKRFSMECRTDSIVRHPELIKKWVDIGLYAVLLGLEGAGDSTLASVHKNNTSRINDEAIRICHDLGVIIWGAFLVDPDFGADDFQRLHDYVASREITHTQYTILTPLPGTELYRQRKGELLTGDYECFDTLHSVLPTRLPREEFYQRFAALYRQVNLGPYYDLISRGKLTVENCRRGKAMLDAMARWELYLEKDPILGRCRDTRDGAGTVKVG